VLMDAGDHLKALAAIAAFKLIGWHRTPPGVSCPWARRWSSETCQLPKSPLPTLDDPARQGTPPGSFVTGCSGNLLPGWGVARPRDAPSEAPCRRLVKAPPTGSLPYSVGQTHRGIARVCSGAERTEHTRAARAAWTSIDREDLVDELAEEFTAHPSGSGGEDPPARG
jgi:hypothetical protein